MIKSFIILALVVVLAAGTFLSKPSNDSFTAFMKTQSQPAQPQSMGDMGKVLIGGIFGQAKAAVFTYNDHTFWATEDMNGQQQYVGMFGHWWKKNAATATPSTPAVPTGS